MKYYKNPKTNELFAYEADGSQDDIIPSHLVQITEAEAKEINEQKRQSMLDARPYHEKRRMEYPPMSEYLDGVVKGDQAQIDAYVAACLAVKAKYPKPE